MSLSFACFFVANNEKTAGDPCRTKEKAVEHTEKKGIESPDEMNSKSKTALPVFRIAGTGCPWLTGDEVDRSKVS
ncbi:hypothetical protein MUN89_05125 [Halobacillus salinarum]|uniref:Uncharacterized protein n=1 Tax=Halobacillus salinarum TaxID=2932257 RepID=A0ABY4ENC2_9BACI|nr:hypothetical protein [Halobacillus salinarum]UOQ45333.1 hypothetical protein MUN89_05125 [Halobacillus salinarum]